MDKYIKKLLEIICIYCASALLTILIFWETNMYSFSARPTELVFWRMLFLSLAIATIIETLLTIFRIIQNKKIEKRNEKTIKSSPSEPKSNNKYTAQDIRKKVLEIAGVYIASWTLTYIILPTLSAICFGPIAGSILGTAFYSCFLFLVLETAIITVKVLERKIRRKAKHAAGNVQETPYISLRIVGTYAISLSLTVNIFLVVDPLSIYYPQADETLIRAFIVSTAIMVFLETIWIVRRSINRN